MPDNETKPNGDPCFYGTVTVGERGQIVVPAELRKELGVAPGDKLLIWQHPSGKGMMLFPVGSMREFMNHMLASLEAAERPDSAHTSDSDGDAEAKTDL